MNIKIEVKEDDYADFGYLGSISDREQYGAIRRPTSELPYEALRLFGSTWRTPDYYYYIPSDNYKGTREWYVKHGYSKHESAMMERSYHMQDLKRLLAFYWGNWCYLGIVVTVEHEGIELGSASIWGVESDSDYSDYIEDLKSDALAKAEENYNNLAESFKVPFSELEIEDDENLS